MRKSGTVVQLAIGLQGSCVKDYVKFVCYTFQLIVNYVIVPTISGTGAAISTKLVEARYNDRRQ
jgi:hypothetical protein